MSRSYILFATACMLALVVGCTSTNDEYTKAKSLTPIEVPETFETERLGELYPVPKGSVEQVQISTPLPPTVGVQSAIAATAFALGERLWVLHNKAPASTWSQLLEFWQSENVEVSQQNVQAATMQTAWFTEAVQPGFEVRYQLVLTRGLQYDSTEIHLLNQVRAQDTGEVPWGDNSDNPNHSLLMLERLEAFLNTRPDALNDSFLATQLNLPARVSYQENDKEPLLLVDIDSLRTTPMLSRSLQQSPLHLYAADTALGVYHINVIEPETGNAFLSRINPFSSRKPLVSPYALPEILETIEQGAEPLNDVPGYLMIVSDISEEQKQIALRDTDGQLLPIDEARLVVDTLRRQLR